MLQPACRLSLPPRRSGTRSAVCSKPTAVPSTSPSARCGTFLDGSTNRRWHGCRSTRAPVGSPGREMSVIQGNVSG